MSTVSAPAIFRAALRLGLTSFGGPIAHIEYFRRSYVERLRWIDAREFADLVTMSQVLPGPASSQLGMAIGMRRRGILGLVAAWLGFTLPSALLMAAFGLIAARVEIVQWLHGLKLAAIAVVLAAVIALARATLIDRATWAIAIGAGVASILLATSWMHLLVIACGALIGRTMASSPADPIDGSPRPRLRGAIPALLLLVPLVALPLIRTPFVELMDAIYRAGILVFGGGHVVLPLLEAGVVRTGLIDPDTFLTGYGAAQAIPGPLFTFAAYLGAVTHGWIGALVATVVIFLPGALLVIAVLPYWDRWRASARTRSAITGANAAVVGVLASVPFLPITRTAITSLWDVLVVVAGLAVLLSRKVPVLVVVAVAAVVGLATAA
jgi:chromate transporter